MNDTAETSNHRFLVALSFPGEKRSFARSVAEILAQYLGKDRVFFDRFYEAELAVLNLNKKLQKIYRDESDLVVPFFCKDYAKKKWCKVEWDAICAAIFARQEDDAVMAIRFDDTPIDGFLETAGYVSVGNRQPGQIADLILERVRARSSGSSPKTTASAEDPFIDVAGSESLLEVPTTWLKSLGEKLRILQREIIPIVTRSRSHKKTTSFRIARYCVTNADYWAYARSKGMVKWPSYWSNEHKKSNHGFPFSQELTDCPVTDVSFEDAKKYCRWRRAGLPLSSEWEIAASAGGESRYPWGDNFNKDFCNGKEGGLDCVCSVSRFPQGDTPSGIRQMAGNVWEWVVGPSDKAELRGGSYHTQCEFWGSVFAFKDAPRERTASDIGFRIVCK
ncbi:MAG: SUMF1/EgtB/PvdO family nonheme iron enzyme [Planctomycetota bacterium]